MGECGDCKERVMELTEKEYISLWLTGHLPNTFPPLGTWKKDLKAGDTFEITMTTNSDGLPIRQSNAIEFADNN